MEIAPEKFECWAILEIMGHQTYAGYVSEQVVAGQAFVRIDIPGDAELGDWTKYFGPSSVYGITPVTEQIARLRAKTLGRAPMSVWDLPDDTREEIRMGRIAMTERLPGPAQYGE